MKVSIIIDNRTVQADSGQNLLQACLGNGIYIPHLCYIDGIKRPLAACRLCFVEIEGEKGPVTACTQTVVGGMIVRTDTVPVRELQRSALELLLSVHEVDCGHCPANKRCELQRPAGMLKVKLRSGGLDRHLKAAVIDNSHPVFDYHPNRCILCGKCVYICGERNERPALSFVKRGLDTVVGFYRDEKTGRACRSCMACTVICPVGAIAGKGGSTDENSGSASDY